MSKTNFFLEKRTNKNTKLPIIDNVPLLLIYNFDGKKLRYFTGHRINFDQWDSEKQEVKRNVLNKQRETASEINRKLNKIRSFLDETYLYFKINEKPLSVELLRNTLNEKLNPVKIEKPVKGFFELFQDFIDAEKITWTKSTEKRVSNSMNHLKAFNSKLSFDDINEDFFQKFIYYSINTKKHQNATILKQIKNTKLFLNWAARKKLHKNVDYLAYQPTKKLKGTKNSDQKNVFFLTWEELMHLYNLEIEINYLQQVRDMFCFCCFTGIRYSDLHNLKRGNINNDSIIVATVKTDDPLRIPLNKYSRSLLEKYNNIQFENDKCFPVISNQKMNDYLKVLGELAEFESIHTKLEYQGSVRTETSFNLAKLLTTHVAKKTFIISAITMDIPIPVIMSITGNSSYDSMKPYIKIVDKLKQQEMNKFNDKK